MQIRTLTGRIKTPGTSANFRLVKRAMVIGITDSTGNICSISKQVDRDRYMFAAAQGIATDDHFTLQPGDISFTLSSAATVGDCTVTILEY